MSEKRAAVLVTSCLIAGLLTVSSSVTAGAAECLSGPNAQSGPGTHWRYRIKHATGQRCWYLKRVGQAARPRLAPESPATSRAPRSGGSEPAPASEASTEKSSSIRAWFSSTFAAFTGLGRSISNTETNEAPANDNAATSKQPNSERAEQKKSQQSKLEQQSKSGQSKPEKEKSDTARSSSRTASLQVILEAAGDKDVPDATTNLSAEEQKTAIEAVGDKDVFAPQTELAQDWQKELYEQFLEWRVKQLMFM
jgi:flagellar biosynthesis GTPase FlhF